MTHAFTSQGSQLKHGNHATPTEVFTLVVEVNNFTLSDKTKEIDVTSFDSVAREFIGGLPAADLKVSGNFIANNTIQQAVHADYVAGTKGNWQLLLADSTQLAFAAVITSFDLKGAVEKQVEVEISLRISGAITYTFNSGSTP